MKAALRTAVALLLLSWPTVAPAQQEDGVLERALEVNEAQGPAATLEFLEAERAKGSLRPQAQALLGALLLAAGRPEESFDALEPITQSQQAPPAVLFNAWRAASGIGRGEERIDLLERAVAIDAVSPAGRQLGLIRGAANRFEEALILLAPWARANPQDLEARLAGATAALQLQRLPAAEELLTGLPQDLPRVRLLWGKLLFLRGDPRGSLATLKALGNGEGLPAGVDRDRRHTMANAYILIGEASEAIPLLEGRQHGDPGIALVLARAQAQSGDVEASLETIRPLAESVMIDPQAHSASLAATALLEFGRQLITTGSPQEAIAPLRLATEVDPYAEEAWQSLGQALAISGRREEARVALERFNELARDAMSTSAEQSTLEMGVADPTGRRLIEALDLQRRGRGSEALELVRSEAKLATGDPRVPVIEAQILYGLGRAEEALAATQTALGISPEYADAYYQRGVILMGERRLDEAEVAYRQALQLAPAHLPSMNDLAVLLIHQQRQEEARQLLERVLELSPEDELAAANLATIGE
jgi:Flp pilus assembly protein TadD